MIARKRITETHIRKQDVSDLVDEYHKFEDKIDLLEDENRLKDEKIREYLGLIDMQRLDPFATGYLRSIRTELDDALNIGKEEER